MKKNVNMNKYASMILIHAAMGGSMSVEDAKIVSAVFSGKEN